MLLDWYSRAYHVGIAAFAREAGWILDATSLHYGVNEAAHFWEGDGAIVMLEKLSPTGKFCQSSQFPIVDLANQFPDIKLPRVLQDNRMIGRLGAEHFLDRGFGNFAFCALSGEIWSEQERFESFDMRLRKNGYEAVLLRWRSAKRRRRLADLRSAMVNHLKELAKPVAIMAHNDELAMLLMDACLEANLAVPEEVAILGCDNDRLAGDFAPTPLSSVEANLEKQGYEGAALLQRLMLGQAPGKRPILIPPVGVETRMSSDVFSVADHGVRKALQFIWHNYTDPLIGVNDVVDASQTGKTSLTRLFHKYLKCDISEKIRYLRIQKALPLITLTHMPFRDVAAICGFTDDKHLRTNVKRETGHSPREYRILKESSRR